MQRKAVKMAMTCLASGFLFTGSFIVSNAAEADSTTNVSTEEESDYEDLVVSQVSNYINIRSGAGTDSEIVGKLYNEEVATVLKEDGDWYKIESGDVTGYICSEYVVRGDEDLLDSVNKTVAVVTTETLRVRSEASTDSSIITLVPIDDELTVLSEEDGWVKVSIEDKEGYVCADYVTCSTQYETASSIEEEEAKESSNSSSTGQSVADYACQFIGNPYVWGGTSLTNGADCSGFVMSVYANFGVSLPHSSSALASVGTAVSYSEAQPGDIICYSGHVGIYIGNGQIVNASSAATGIKTQSATYKSIVAVRRIF